MQSHIIIAQAPNGDFLLSKGVLLLDNRAVDNPRQAYLYIESKLPEGTLKTIERIYGSGLMLKNLVAETMHTILYKDVECYRLTISGALLCTSKPAPDDKFTFAIVRDVGFNGDSQHSKEYFSDYRNIWVPYNTPADISWKAWSDHRLQQEILADRLPGAYIIAREK